jgi:hypothetical protein
MKNTIKAPVKNNTTGKKAQSTKLTKGANGMELKVNNPKKPVKAKKPVLQVAEGVTGKQVREEQFKANREYLTELKSPSGAYRGFKAHFQNWGSLIIGFNMDECTPDKVLDFRTERQKSFKGVSVFVYSECVRKFYLAKK